MAPNRSPRKPRTQRTEEPDPQLLAHIQSLGLATVDDYLAWCARHGFGRRAQKHWRLREGERAFARRATADARLARKKQEQRNPAKIVDRIFRGELREADVTELHWKAVCQACQSKRESRATLRAFQSLLKHARTYSDLISSRPAIGHIGRQVGNTFVAGLLALARHWQSWIRPIHDWRPQSHNCRRQFSSLARHLLAEWPLPAFMDSVWFLGSTAEATRRQAWFLHVGRGRNIRTADLPLPFTKRMAHHFLQAPADLTVDGALRWGQIQGLGGSERLARAIIATRIGNSFEHDDFWLTVLRFFVANAMLDLAHVGPIVDYIHNQRFVAQDVFVAPGVIERRGAAQPNFTIKGRTAASLLRQVDSWHRTLAQATQSATDWPPSGIAGFEFVEGTERSGNRRIWTITELLSSKALVAEGREMKHCVASYARSCARRIYSIWTMEAKSFEGRSKVLTIAVQNQSRTIWHARGKCNALPAEKHLGILRRWAEQAELSVGTYL